MDNRPKNRAVLKGFRNGEVVHHEFDRPYGQKPPEEGWSLFWLMLAAFLMGVVVVVACRAF